MKTKEKPLHCLFITRRQLSLLRWLVKDAEGQFPLTRAEREVLIPELKRKLK